MISKRSKSYGRIAILNDFFMKKVKERSGLSQTDFEKKFMSGEIDIPVPQETI